MILKRIYKPKISIVTPTFNQGQYIEQTIHSVLDQNCPNLEYIIIDGGSTDDTLAIIKKYEKHLKYWVSEPDKGQANAINRGLEHCTGEIFNWLNSDDYLADGALKNIAKAFSSSDADAVAGQTIYFEKDKFEQPVQLSGLNAKDLLLWKRSVNFIQPGLWMRRELIQRCGGLDEHFQYAFDWDLVIRYLHLFPKIHYLEEPLVYFRLHEDSKTVSSLEEFHREEEKIIEKYKNSPKWSELGDIGKFRQERALWNDRIKQISEGTTSNISKARILVSEALDMPKIRMSRITLGAIKRILLTGDASI